jgi:YhcN/YlaJ family sporulation lipoprotein
MNKKFLQTAAFTMGLAIMSVPFTACNVRTNDTNPQKTGITDRQNTTQYGSPIRYSNNGYERIDGMRLNGITPAPRNGNVSDNGTGRINNNTPQPRTILDTTPGAYVNDMNTMQSKSQNIEKQIKNLPNIKDANVMVVGNTALVACSPDTTSVDTNALRNSITQKVKSVDPSINNVVITESSDMMANVRQMLSDMNNRSMNQITNDFNNLIRQITPSMS